jgi:MoaA/NifB/PqqE/SkfB family radical SAM enzyme
MAKSVTDNRELADREFSERRSKLTSLPLMVAVYTTDRCNLRCMGCDFGRKTGSEISITEEGYQRVFDVFPFLDTVGIAGAEMFHNTGDAKGHMQRVCREGEKYPDLRFIGFSNGTLLSAEKIDFIVRKFKWFGVSIDSPIPSVYRTIRIGSNLNRVIQNIKKLNQLKVEKGLERYDSPEIIVSSVIFERTYRSVMGMVDLAYEVGAAGVHFQEPWEGTYVNENIFSNHTKMIEYLSMRKEAVTKANDLGIFIIDRTINTILRNMPDLKDHLEIPENLIVGKWPNCCNAPWSELYISGNGDVQVCCASNTILGNINEQSISQIWNSSEAIALRWRILKGDYVRDCKPRCNKGYFLPLHKRRKLSHRLINLMLDRKRLAGLLGNKQWMMGLLRDRKRLADVILDRRV